MKPPKGSYTHIDEITRANERAGMFFFSPGTMRGFQSRIGYVVFNGCLFVSSEKGRGQGATRGYTIRYATPDGDIGQLGDFQFYNSMKQAEGVCEAIQRGDYYILLRHDAEGEKYKPQYASGYRQALQWARNFCGGHEYLPAATGRRVDVAHVSAKGTYRVAVVKAEALEVRVEKTFDKMLLALADIMEHFGADSAAGLNRRVYKDTDCGASISLILRDYSQLHNGQDREKWEALTPDSDDVRGFTIQTIVEGSEATVDSDEFRLPVLASDVDQFVEYMEREAARLFDEANAEGEEQAEEVGVE